jgi:hypothetical protein
MPMPNDLLLPIAVAIPGASRITQAYGAVNLADAFAIGLPADASADPAVLARFIVSSQPSWIGTLTALRDLVVACIGLKTSRHLASLAGDGKPERIGPFQVYSTDETEIVIGEDDKHLDFRVSLLCSCGPAPESRQLTVSTVVHCHNRLGRTYLMIIAPFHRAIVKASLRRGARIGWPLAAGRSRLAAS